MSLITNKPLTFTISYGFLEGNFHGRQLRKRLTAAGFRQAPSLQAADIVIAHSAGCLALPQQGQARLILYIGAPLPQPHPAGMFVKVSLKNAVTLFNEQVGLLATINLYHLWYGVARLRYNFHVIWKVVRHYSTLVDLPESQVVFIANRHDLWPQGSQLNGYLATKNWSFVSLPGAHDDIWMHPTNYVKLVEYYAKLLA